MRLHELIDLPQKEWLEPLQEINRPATVADAASRQADQLVRRGKLAKKQAAVVKAQKALASKRRDLAQAQNTNLPS